MEQILKTLRKQAWLLGAIFKRYRVLVGLAFLISIILFVLAARLLPFTSLLQQQQSIIGLVGQFTPTTLPLGIQRLVSSGLTDVDAQGQVLPSLASSWDISENGTQYTFHLRSDLVWHDGKPFTAYDVNYNLRNVTFTPQNDTTLKVTLKEPFTPLPTFLSKPLFRKGLIGLGSYKISPIKLKGEYVSYLKLMPQHPELPVVEIKFYPSETVAKTAFKLGEVTVLDEITDPSPFTEWKTVSIKETVKHDQYVGLFFKLSDPLLENKEVRQGLAFAIEKTEKNRIATPISSESWAYTNRVKQYEKDLDAAKELIGSSLFGKTITISTFSQYLSLAQIIASSWEALGITVKVKVENGVPADFQVLLATQEIPPDPDQYTLWHSTQEQTNISGYASAKIDKLLEDGRKELDQEARKKIYFDFQRYLVEDAPVVFLFHPTTYTVTRKQ